MRSLDVLRDLMSVLRHESDDPPRPGPSQGGKVYVTYKDTDRMASLTDCWCGQPNGHDWPMKADGAPHPRYPS